MNKRQAKKSKKKKGEWFEPMILNGTLTNTIMGTLFPKEEGKSFVMKF